MSYTPPAKHDWRDDVVWKEGGMGLCMIGINRILYIRSGFHYLYVASGLGILYPFDCSCCIAEYRVLDIMIHATVCLKVTV